MTKSWLVLVTLEGDLFRNLAGQHGFKSGSDDHLRAILDNYDLKRLTTQVGQSLLEILERHYSYVDEHLNRIHQ